MLSISSNVCTRILVPDRNRGLWAALSGAEGRREGQGRKVSEVSGWSDLCSFGLLSTAPPSRCPRP